MCHSTLRGARVAALLLSLTSACYLAAQSLPPAAPPLTDRERSLLERVDKLEARIALLESIHGQQKPPQPAEKLSPAQQNERAATDQSAPLAPVTEPSKSASPPSGSPLSFSDGTTLNFNLDGYYGYNFDHPAGRANLLRANDVLSNSFSLNQVGVIVERAPDVSEKRRAGYRMDLMFGQNTETLQGSPLNEPRTQVYRNIFQAYGSYILPLGSGLQVDFGKFASSLGYEGNYTKDQLNYSRSYYFNALPFYHMGIRATYNLNSKLSLQYWLVNGANQTEDFNGFKSQAVLLTYKPSSSISWNLNYYEGQEQRDVAALSSSNIQSPLLQAGLSTDPVGAAHDGRLHILDTYAAFNLGKWTTAVEADYVINRVAANAGPTRIYGGVGYLHRQLTPSLALNGRFGYLRDQGGLFTGTTQDLKDITATAIYQLFEGLQTRLEYRRDFTNQPFFLTNNPGQLRGLQSTATIGLNWWFGGKTGSW